jgi:hypothetical protein
VRYPSFLVINELCSSCQKKKDESKTEALNPQKMKEDLTNRHEKRCEKT